MKITIVALVAFLGLAAMSPDRRPAPAVEDASHTAFTVDLRATLRIRPESSTLLLVGWLRNGPPELERQGNEPAPVHALHRTAMVVLRLTLREILGIHREES